MLCKLVLHHNNNHKIFNEQTEKKIEEFPLQHHQVVDHGGGRDGMSRNIIDFVISPAFSLSTLGAGIVI